MLKKMADKYIPKADDILKYKSMRVFGNYIFAPNLWVLNRHTAPKATAVGIFCAFLPMPFQMLVSAAIAIPLRANLPLSVALVWITNPITIPPVFYFCYRVGLIINGMEPSANALSFSLEWLSGEIGYVWYPLLTGSLLCGVTFGTLGYYGIKYLWQYNTLRKWKNRHLQLPNIATLK